MTTAFSSGEMLVLAGIAAAAVEDGTRPGDGQRCDAHHPGIAGRVRHPGMSFVTLDVGGERAGCKGSIEPVRPLWEDVAHNARRAGFEDERYTPVSRDRLGELTIKLSVLSPLEELPAASLHTVAAALRPRVDGLVLSAAGRGAVYLPMVWQRAPEPADFVAALVDKAGWPRPWMPGARAWRYTTQEVSGPFTALRGLCTPTRHSAQRRSPSDRRSHR